MSASRSPTVGVQPGPVRRGQQRQIHAAAHLGDDVVFLDGDDAHDGGPPRIGMDAAGAPAAVLARGPANSGWLTISSCGTAGRPGNHDGSRANGLMTLQEPVYYFDHQYH
jgi:hypothetical protein